MTELTGMIHVPDASAATSSRIWGIVAMLTWMIPPVGLLAGLTGLVLGIRGWEAPNAHRARVGVTLSTVALFLTLWLRTWIMVVWMNRNV